MHLFPAVVLVPCLFITSVAADEKASLSTEADRISYAIGHQIGADFKKQNVDLDNQAITQGMVDGHMGTRPMMDPKEMSQRLVNLKRNITDDTKAKALERMKKRQAEMKHKREIGKDFLAANKEKTDVITTESGMQYKVITPGTGTSPQLTERVKIHYKSKRLNGQVINSSHLKGEPGVFPVSGLIPGVIEALKMMQPGGNWELYLPSKLAYGRKGPFAHETIIVEMELLEILPPDTAEATQSQNDEPVEINDRDEHASH